MIGLLAAGALLLLISVVLDRLAGGVTTPELKPVERTVPELGLPYEALSIGSDDQELHAWLVRAPGSDDSGPLLILAHGWTANSGILLALGEPLVRAGWDVLPFDVRGHGCNEPTGQVTVRHFRDDLMAVAQYAATRFPDRALVVVGHSMGGAAAILAAADGAPVDALVLIATPADVIRVTAEYLDERGLPGALMMMVLRPFLWRRVHSSFLPLTPARRIRELDLPMILIQPEDDLRVVPAHAERLSEAAGLAVHYVPNREHTDVLSAPRTLALVEEFLQRLDRPAPDDEA